MDNKAIPLTPKERGSLMVELLSDKYPTKLDALSFLFSHMEFVRRNDLP